MWIRLQKVPENFEVDDDLDDGKSCAGEVDFEAPETHSFSILKCTECNGLKLNSLLKE